MNPLTDMRGIITVLNTPFTRDDAIDEPGLRANIQAALQAGVVGFLVPALASEVGKLSEAERTTLVRVTLEEARGHAAVIGGASADTSERRQSAARNLIELGCDGILANIPYQDDDQYRRDISALAELAPPFLMIQDWDPSGFGAPVPLIAQLVQEIPAFRCLKVEVVPAGVKYSAVLEATQGALHVSGGWAVTQMIEAMDRGVHAFMPTGMHPIYTRIFSLYQSGQREAAQTLFRRLLPVLAFSNQHLDISIHFFKRLLHRQGIYATPRVRDPILPFDDIHEKVSAELIEHVINLQDEVSNL